METILSKIKLEDTIAIKKTLKLYWSGLNNLEYLDNLNKEWLYNKASDILM